MRISARAAALAWSWMYLAIFAAWMVETGAHPGMRQGAWAVVLIAGALLSVALWRRTPYGR